MRLCLRLVPHELQLERGALLWQEEVEDDLLRVAVGGQLDLGAQELEGPFVMQSMQGVQRRLALGSVGLGGAELDPQAEDVAQEDLELDLLVVLGAEMLAGDLAADAVERLHEVRGEERRLDGLGAPGLVHEVLQLGFDEGAHARLVREEERVVLAEEASRGVLLGEHGVAFLEEVPNQCVSEHLVDGDFVEADLAPQRPEDGLGPELDVVVHAGPDLAHGLDEADPLALGRGREVLDHARLQGGRDGVQQERQAVVVRGRELGLPASVAEELAKLVVEGEGGGRAVLLVRLNEAEEELARRGSELHGAEVDGRQGGVRVEEPEELAGLEAGLAAGVEGAPQELLELGLLLHGRAQLRVDVAGRVERVEVKLGVVEAVGLHGVGVEGESVEEELDERDRQRENVVRAHFLARGRGAYLGPRLPDVGRSVVAREHVHLLA